jgi:MFS family permease
MTAPQVDSEQPSRRSFLAWSLAALAILSGIFQLLFNLFTGQMTDIGEWFLGSGFSIFIPLAFGILGALIVSRQNGNRVGWLMVIVALGAGTPLSTILEAVMEPVEILTIGQFLLIWFDNWSWIIFIFPIFLIPLHFPDGRPPSPRWNWVNRLALGMWLFFAVITLFVENGGPIEGDWTAPNPIGFIPESPDSFFGSTFLIVWGIGLLTIIAGSVVSLFVRYRQSGQRARDQIKWIMYAGVIFFISYGLAFFSETAFSSAAIVNLIFMVSLMVFPTAITIAILRHQLYDINLIIRRTLQYTLITALLAVVYFGGIVILQGLVGSLTGDTNSPIITVITTLGIAALFNPLRTRVQEFVDQRFFRQKYDAELALSRFAAAGRDEVDVDKFAATLMDLTSETMQPEKVSLWLRPDPGRGKSAE